MPGARASPPGAPACVRLRLVRVRLRLVRVRLRLVRLRPRLVCPQVDPTTRPRDLDERLPVFEPMMEQNGRTHIMKARASHSNE